MEGNSIGGTSAFYSSVCFRNCGTALLDSLDDTAESVKYLNKAPPDMIPPLLPTLLSL